MSKNTKSIYTLEDSDADRFFSDIEKIEKAVNKQKLAEKHGEEQYNYEATPYSIIQDFLEQLHPAKGEIVYDLGSGYGRVVIFGALNSEAEFRGIEIVGLRNKNASELAKKLGVENAKFVTGNVLDHDLSDGDIFFLFNPFTEATLELVGIKLRDVSKNKNIRIATWGGPSDDYFLAQDWLRHIQKDISDSPLEYFESI